MKKAYCIIALIVIIIRLTAQVVMMLYACALITSIEVLEEESVILCSTLMYVWKSSKDVLSLVSH